MPKVLVLFHSRTGRTAALADAIDEGARSVKFTEVDVRRLDDLAPLPASDADGEPPAGRARLAAYRVFGDLESLADYDAIVLGSPVLNGAMTAELTRLLDQAGPLGARGALVDRVGAAFTSAPADGDATRWSIMARMADLGMILVPPDRAAPATDALSAARLHGARVAKVAEWVAHAKGHEQAHAHSHPHHGHSHEHPHGPSHGPSHGHSH